MKRIIYGICLLLSGCTGYQYVTAPNYVPVHQEKGELTGIASLNYLQIGYAFSDKFSVYTSGFHRNNDFPIKSTVLYKENSGVFVQFDKQLEFDLGFTFYKTLNEYFSYEIVSGLGSGSVKYSNLQDLLTNYEFSFSANKLSFFIQPDFSFRLNKYLDFSVFWRVNQTRYYDINKSLTLGSMSEPEKYDQYFNIRDAATFLFNEPGFQFRGGFEHVKFQFMYSRVFDFYNTGIQYRPDNLYLGISMRFNINKNR